ncbi:MAG: hypothetical protein J5816_00105, partial [Clostridia bacterium]|nr:hypothetical protein [Clostridia bacterium]
LGSAVANYIYSLEQAAAGTGIQYFKNLFPKCENAEYNAGSLISVKTSASITTGLNQWDEDWEIGAIDNGNNVTYNQSIRGKNYMPCIPNTVYHIHIGSGAYVVIWWYGATYNYLSNSTVNNTTFTAPANAHYFRISMSAAYGTVYNNDICINIHGERDGEYEAYYKHEYALDSTRELHGVMMLDANNNLYYDGDTYSPSGAGANNYGIIDLGTLTWSGSNGSFSTSLSLMKKINSVNAVRIVCPKYIQAASTVSQSIRTNGMYIAVNDSSYSDAATFKTALSGIYLVYPLETPTAEAASAYTNPQTVNGDGTEQFVDSRTIPVPVGQDTYYRNNLRKRLLETPDSPRADGDYILQRRNGKNEYAPLPDPPSTNGTYKFTATVSGGTVTYSWVSST